MALSKGPFILHRDEHSIPLPAATTLLPKQLVRLVGTDVTYVAPCATASHEVFGQVDATFLSEEIAAVYEAPNYVKVVAAASLGAGQDVIVASSNGALNAGGITASAHFLAGKSFTAAAAGEVFTLRINPRKA
jgi:hypothetical protein